MDVWIVKDHEDQIVDVFKTAEGACAYLMAELQRWHDEYPNDFDNYFLQVCRGIVLEDFVREQSVIRAGIPDENFWLRAIKFEVKE